MKDLSTYIGYCRVSTQRQFTEGHGLERYIYSLKKYGLQDNQIFWDIESGKNETRKGYNTVLHIIRQGKVKNLVVPCFDRFTRSVIQWEKAKEEFQKLGVKVLFLEGGSLDLSTPEGTISAGMMALFASFTAEKNKLNSLNGHKFLRVHEKAFIAGFGYIKENDTFVVNRELYKDTNLTYYDIARECINTFLSHKTISSTVNTLCTRYGFKRISKIGYLDFPREPSAFKYWLLNPQLRGYISYFNKDKDKQIISDTPRFEPILLEDEYTNILRILEQNKITKLKKTTLVNPLIGLCFCKQCGSKMITKGSGTKKKYSYLICKGAYPHPGTPQVCDRRSSYGLTIQSVVDKVIQSLIVEFKSISKWGYLEPDIINESEEIIELRKSINKLESFNDPDLLEVINTKKTKLLNLVNDSKLESSYKQEKLIISNKLASMPEFWHSDTTKVEDIYAVFQELVKKVECDQGEIHISLNIGQSSY